MDISKLLNFATVFDRLKKANRHRKPKKRKERKEQPEANS
jgi:hypothetical protein